LSRYSDILPDGCFPLFDRTLHIDVMNLFAEIGLCVDETDKTVFHLKVDIGAFFDVFGEGTDGFDG